MKEASGLVLPPTLQTERLVLRPLRPGDEGAVFAYASDPEVARWTLWEPHESLEASRTFIADYAYANYRQEVPDPYGIVWRDRPDRLIGTVGCHWASAPHLTMELGFALGKEYWGRGLITEAGWAALCFAFSICRPNRIQARCHPDNPSSARVLTKLGMRGEGRLRSAACKGSEIWDVQLFALVRRDWQEYLSTGRAGPPGAPL